MFNLKATLYKLTGVLLIISQNKINCLFEAAKDCNGDISSVAVMWRVAGRTMCTGVHIGGGYVATAKHCKIKDTEFQFGEKDLSGTDCKERSGMSKTISWIHGNSTDDDLAIAYVSNPPVQFTQIIPEESVLRKGMSLQYKGYGTNELYRRTMKCKQSEFSIEGFSNDFCQTLSEVVDNHRQICIANRGIEMNYEGDSGGPFFLNNKLAGTLYGTTLDKKLGIVNMIAGKEDYIAELVANRIMRNTASNTELKRSIQNIMRFGDICSSDEANTNNACNPSWTSGDCKEDMRANQVTWNEAIKKAKSCIARKDRTTLDRMQTECDCLDAYPNLMTKEVHNLCNGTMSTTESNIQTIQAQWDKS